VSWPRSPSTGVADQICIIRGGGDLGTGVAWRLTRAGFPVIVLELADPLTVRRTVALSSAVREGSIEIEGMVGRRVADHEQAVEVARSGEVAVVVSAALIDAGASVVVDARLAKRNIDTSMADAALVIGLGPGFTAGIDCHAVVETMRGHHLGRVLWSGSAAPNTGTPGVIGGRGRERVVRAPGAGPVTWAVDIGVRVKEGDHLGAVGGIEMAAPFDGVARGLIAPGTNVVAGLKIGDIDPRAEPSYCWEISDKALSIGGGVLEAVMAWTIS